MRTLEGLSSEALHFWDRLGDGTRRAEATLATRLLAWHVATDLPFARRVSFFQLLRQSAEQLAPRGHPPRPAEAVREFHWLLDAYLPYPVFVLNAEPPQVVVRPPTFATLERLAGTIQLPLVEWWPMTNLADVPRLYPALVHILGEPVREWWGERDPARRAVERGLASLPFADRQRIYHAIFSEWHRAILNSDHWANARDLAQRFVNRFWEWVDAVRFSECDIIQVPESPQAEVAAPVIVSPPPTPEPMPVATPVAMPVSPPKAVAPKPVSKPQPERVTAKVAEPFAMVTFDSALAYAQRHPWRMCVLGWTRSRDFSSTTAAKILRAKSRWCAPKIQCLPRCG